MPSSICERFGGRTFIYQSHRADGLPPLARTQLFVFLEWHRTQSGGAVECWRRWIGGWNTIASLPLRIWAQPPKTFFRRYQLSHHP
ncbi:uncharacterized protein PHALS_08597 [Plasmopara halstedii]|uniref:Uncharacterized protein n=1 Tax=Plasmopara halstedii TaxID=4781 RepID=A0A0P1AC54_PLAHL|nr:uncharacterized protein PHALS_08597 [Plasmopara halstedii]CEG38529.1 hypothetical protein PHALS_08597 [Plasmopara halstedii]|eukprot:XP_024574898.1 hypothetical protein PHALS_08597 [Plasmopara halstedii]